MTQPDSELGKQMIDSIREHLLEKIGRDEWNRKPLEERHKLEIECIDKNFDLSNMSKGDLETISDYLEDKNYHGPSNYLRKIGGLPYWDLSRSEMVYPKGD